MNVETSEFLDSCRGFASIVVLLAHINQVFMLPCYGVNGAISLIPGYLASCAVVLFFLVSGYVIAHSIAKSRMKAPNAWLFDFILRRIARIYPPLIFALLLTFSVISIIYMFDMHGKYSFRLEQDLYLARESIMFEGRKYFYTLLMLPGFFISFTSLAMNGPLWSISYEFWMYLIAGFSVYAFYSEKRILMLFLLAISAFQCITSNEKFIYFGLIWLMGFGCFLIRDEVIIKWNKLLPYLYTLILLCMLYILKTYGQKVFVPYSAWYAYLFQFLLAAVGVLSNYIFKIWRISALRIFKSTAQYSYTLYLIHFPVLLISFSALHQHFMHLNIMSRLSIFTVLAIMIISISAVVAKVIENSIFFYNLIRSLLNLLTLKKNPSRFLFE